MGWYQRRVHGGLISRVSSRTYRESLNTTCDPPSFEHFPAAPPGLTPSQPSASPVTTRRLFMAPPPEREPRNRSPRTSPLFRVLLRTPRSTTFWLVHSWSLARRWRLSPMLL